MKIDSHELNEKRDSFDKSFIKSNNEFDMHIAGLQESILTDKDKRSFIANS